MRKKITYVAGREILVIVANLEVAAQILYK